jgi:hypothetical protein
MHEWEAFYVIVGSAAAALTGLMFVVIALLSDFGTDFETNPQQVAAFGTPTVVHFGAALLQSAILSAPWPSMGGLRIALGVYGLAALIYTLIVLKRARGQTGYQPVFEDWLFSVILPLAAYTAILLAAWRLPANPTWLLFVIGGAALLVLFIGIHNAWDTVTYIVLTQLEKRRSGKADESNGAQP